jgi:DNA polymerase III sliding clamp (beta) subunit (PCNA family)
MHSGYGFICLIGNKLGKIKSVIPSKTTISALKGVLYSKQQLTAYNLEVGIIVNLEVEESAMDESFIIPIKAVEKIENAIKKL